MSELLDRVIEIVKEAGAVFLDRSNLYVENKDTNSNYVTSGDKKVQEFLVPRLTELVEHSTVLAEEEEQEDLSGEYLWVIDPIDGTSNYVRNFGFSCISVALEKDGETLLGVVYDPDRDEMFSCEKGKGAFLNGKRIHVSERPFSKGLLFSAMSLYKKEYSKSCFNIIQRVYAEADDLRRTGSAALELCYLASGRGELYFEMRVFPWDVKAGMLMIEEAGGETEIVYGRPASAVMPFPVIAANSKENLSRLREIVTDEIKEVPYES